MYQYFRRLVSLESASSFENVICQVVAKEGRLFVVNIPSETWIPVNTLKELECVTAVLERSE
jgi:hypothetical protein